MTQRKSLSKKIRFEVFKRDNFTCQYCGAKAPDRILEIDHITAVSKGGKDDIMNLITSCFDCNRGKSNREISDKSIVEKQRMQIEELNIRRQQLEMILEWRTGLDELKNHETQAVNDLISKITGSRVIDESLENLKKVIKKFGFAIAISATEKAFQQYSDDNDFWECFRKIGPIANMLSQPKHLQKIAYAKGILRNRRVDFHESDIHESMLDCYKAGLDMDDLIAFCKTVEEPEDLFQFIFKAVY